MTAPIPHQPIANEPVRGESIPGAGAGVTVTVRGTFEAFHPPERATVRLTVGHQGPDKQAVFAWTTESANRVGAALGGLHDPEQGPVTWWSGDRLRTYAEKPWNDAGTQLPLVFHASVGMQAKFRDFAALAHFLDDVSAWPGVGVDHLDWALTEARKHAVVRDTRQRAVRDATSRATDYAAALGLTTVRAVAVADVGMLGGEVRYEGGGDGGGYGRVMLASAEAGGHGRPLDLTPEDVAVTCSVDVRFVAT